MLRAMKFNESGLKCWPYQCNVVLSQTYSSSGDYLWNVNCSGNVTESRGGGRGRKVEEGEGTESRGGGGRESNPDWRGISYQRNRNKLRQQYETVSQAHFTLCLGNYKKNKNKKQGVGYSEVIFASVFVNFDLLSRADSHRRDNRFGA